MRPIQELNELVNRKFKGSMKTETGVYVRVVISVAGQKFKAKGTTKSEAMDKAAKKALEYLKD